MCTSIEKISITEAEVVKAGRDWFIHRKDKKKTVTPAVGRLPLGDGIPADDGPTAAGRPPFARN